MSAEYPNPDNEFVLMQQAAEAVDGVVEELAYRELVPEVEAIHRLGSAATDTAVAEMLDSLEQDLAAFGDPEGFGDVVEADLANNPVADEAAAYLQAITSTSGVSLGKAATASGKGEPDMAYRVALDTLRGNFGNLASSLVQRVDLTKPPKS